MKKIKYQTRCVMSCFNRVIELSKKMLILKRFVAKSDFFYVTTKTELFLENFYNVKLFCL